MLDVHPVVSRRAAVTLLGLGAGLVAAVAVMRSATSPTHVHTSVTDAGGVPREARLRLWCADPTHRISPLVYGVGYYPITDAKDGYLWSLGPGARRWGGNYSSRYNWRLGNSFNTAYDWYFRNVEIQGNRPLWRAFLAANRAHGVRSELTVPMIGWVAKDSKSKGFPVSVFGPQKAVDPYVPDAGNGQDAADRPIPPGPPTRTSVRFTPEDAAAWVRAIRAYDRKRGGRSVDVYILDNEPMLWHKTHRDVHPEPVGYDELLARTIAYAHAIRRADPGARIAGPSLWGWPAYFFSAKDADAGFFFKPDRRAHGDVPLLEWYLRELGAYERRTGERLIDLVDVHFYPDLPKEGSDPALWAKRLRSTRALWDSTYRDESYIDEKVALLPRLAKIIADNHPGLGIQIGEYNFGGERDPSGALALAEVLGRLGAEPAVSAAFYWSYPPDGSPAAAAFRAFRNYDGKKSRFGELALRSEAPAGVSLFASRDASGGRVVAVALNLDPSQAREATLALTGCGTATAVRAFGYSAPRTDLAPVPARVASNAVRVGLPPYSITVVEVTTAAVAQER